MVAIVVHVLVAGLGGRVCFRTSPIEVVATASERCARHCCDPAPERVAPAADLFLAAHFDLAAGSLAPNDSDCCTEPSTDLLAPAPLPAVYDALMLAPVPAAIFIATAWSGAPGPACTLRRDPHRLAQPPPALEAVRVTVILV